jgi:1,4-alpha-glucan branching enzyme
MKPLGRLQADGGAAVRRQPAENVPGAPLIKTTRPDRDDVVRITFVLPADEPAGGVSVVGDFNDWDPFAHPLRRRTNGTRSAVVRARAGCRLQFRYLAEGGLWFDDETADQLDQNGASIAV